MLKLIFSPYYDGNCYAGNPKKCVLGTKYVGPLGLLNELELRAGLSRGENSSMQRSVAYCSAIREVLEKIRPLCHSSNNRSRTTRWAWPSSCSAGAMPCVWQDGTKKRHSQMTFPPTAKNVWKICRQLRNIFIASVSANVGTSC